MTRSSASSAATTSSKQLVKVKTEPSNNNNNNNSNTLTSNHSNGSGHHHHHHHHQAVDLTKEGDELAGEDKVRIDEDKILEFDDMVQRNKALIIRRRHFCQVWHYSPYRLELAEAKEKKKLEQKIKRLRDATTIEPEYFPEELYSKNSTAKMKDMRNISDAQADDNLDKKDLTIDDVKLAQVAEAEEQHELMTSLAREQKDAGSLSPEVKQEPLRSLEGSPTDHDHNLKLRRSSLRGVPAVKVKKEVMDVGNGKRRKTMGDVSSLEPLQNREAIYSREGGEVLQNGDALDAQNGNEDQYNNAADEDEFFDDDNFFPSDDDDGYGHDPYDNDNNEGSTYI